LKDVFKMIPLSHGNIVARHKGKVEFGARAGIRKVALSGGVFMNVKANQRILEVPELFVFPSCGDETNAIGAAWFLCNQTL
jgi:predicted NodU family carbamoyl transferase